MASHASVERAPRPRAPSLKYFLPIAAVLAAAVMGSTLLLSSLFMDQSRRLLEGREVERLRRAMGLFTRINLGSVPAFVSMSEEEPVRDFLRGRGLTMERVLRGLERIDASMVGSDVLDSVYLYSEAAGVLSTRAGWEKGRPPSDPGLASFLGRIRGYGLARYVTRTTTFDGEKAPRNLFSLVIGYVPKSGPPHSAFVLNLSERKVRAALAADASPTAVLYLVGKDGRFLSHPDPAAFGAPADADPRIAAAMRREEPEGLATVRGADGAPYLAAWADQEEMGWRFISLAPEGAVLGGLLGVRDRVLGFSALVLALSAAAAFALSLSMGARERRTELALAYLRGELEADEHGAPRFPGSPATPRALFPAARFPVQAALFRFDGRLHKGGSLPYSVVSGFPALVTARGGTAFRAGENAFLALLPSADPPLRARAEELAAAMSPEGAVLGGWLLPGAFSFADLPSCFARLDAATDLDYLREQGAFAEPPEPVDPAALPEGQDPGAEREAEKVVRAFRVGDREEALRRSGALLSRLREARDGDLFRFTVSRLARGIVDSFGAEAEPLLPGGAEAFRSALAEAECLASADELLGLAAGRLAERGVSHAERRQKAIVGRVLALVEERIADRSLGTAGIAAEVGLSASYLRDLFKHSEGVGLLEHIGQRRIELAKELLAGSDAPVREVCSRSGFINYSYFFTYFKKSTGKTPSEYRVEARSG
jgi:AraC-like DNA-binding protein